MASSVSTTVNWDWGKIDDIQNNAIRGLIRLGYDIAEKARLNAPHKTGALSNSIRVEENAGVVNVIAGGKYSNKNVPYAAIQEFGGNAGRGRKAHITGKHYMERAQELVMAGDYKKKYFGGIV